ncbi:hypothetical protein IFM89_002787 [Coptis chinensis]|uniref:Uncharacterized protein n=1 Tax=Coptis chinensis TaxID=261450 RepID=A0A835HTF7_9MAGN|nr:hypothetical protein IFM89_002787 [Coptis chinensis]
MANQWCVDLDKKENITLAASNVDYACGASDCTPLGAFLFSTWADLHQAQPNQERFADLELGHGANQYVQDQPTQAPEVQAQSTDAQPTLVQSTQAQPTQLQEAVLVEKDVEEIEEEEEDEEEVEEEEKEPEELVAAMNHSSTWQAMFEKHKKDLHMD